MVTVGAFPGHSGLGDPNPYQALFYHALERSGVKWWGECNPWKCIGTDEWPDWIHLHWPELLWKDRPPQFVRRLRRLPGGWRTYERLKPVIDFGQMLRLIRILRMAKKRGCRVAWTLHNVKPHEGASAADKFGYAHLTKLADLCIAHSEVAIGEFESLYGKLRRVLVMPIGNYDGVYPEPVPRTDVLRGLGFSAEHPTVCCLGNVREYKGIDLAVEAARLLAGRVQLVIAGQVRPGFDQGALAQKIASLDGVKLLPGFVDNQTFSNLIHACDATLLPYRQITGSSVLMASLTMGVGVIASDLPYFREMLSGNEGAGSLFLNGDPAKLAAAIESYLAVSSEKRREAALALSRKYAWDIIVSPVAEAMSNP